MIHKFVIELIDDYKGFEQDVDYLERVYGAEPIKEHDEEIYNKAVDDFAEKLKRENKETIPTHSGYFRMSFDEVVDEMAEQLKEGRENEE